MGYKKVGKEIPEFTVMRALAIFIILFHHLPAYCINYYDLNFLGLNYDLSVLNDLNRYFALGIFVYISGYLLNAGNAYFANWRDVKQFAIKRVIRIMPLYTLALLMFIILFPPVRESMNIFSFFVHIFGLQVFFASRYCDPILTLWFVGLIIAYYVLFIILVTYGTNNKRLMGAVFIISIVAIIVKGTVGIIDRRLILYFGIFIAGILSSKKEILRKLSWYQVIPCVVLFAFAIYLYAIFIYPELVLSANRPSLVSLVSVYAFILLNVIMLLCVFTAYFFSKCIVDTSAYRYIAIISYSSYSIFLFHRLIWWSMLQILNPDNDITRGMYLGFLGIPVVIFASYYIQEAYDWFCKKLIGELSVKKWRRSPSFGAEVKP